MRTIEISDTTYEKIKGQLLADEVKDISELKDFEGEKIFFRTVTYHIVARVKKVIGAIFMLEQASWVADSGRFMNAIRDGVLDEVEPLGDWNVNISTVTDFGPWRHQLPTEQK